MIGVRLLCQSHISAAQISTAREQLLKFYQIYEVLYGMQIVISLSKLYYTCMRFSMALGLCIHRSVSIISIIVCGFNSDCFFIGTKSVTMKLHLLQHLPDVVERWGGLWAYSCFWYESLNGVLKNFIHGTRFVCSQVQF